MKESIVFRAAITRPTHFCTVIETVLSGQIDYTRVLASVPRALVSALGNHGWDSVKLTFY